MVATTDTKGKKNNKNSESKNDVKNNESKEKEVSKENVASKQSEVTSVKVEPGVEKTIQKRHVKSSKKKKQARLGPER